jgi:hypothetical protein
MKRPSALPLLFFLAAAANAQQPTDVFVTDVPTPRPVLGATQTSTQAPAPTTLAPIPVTATAPAVQVPAPPMSSTDSVPTLSFLSTVSSIPPLSTDQFARACANTADPADCGKKVEAEQMKRAAPSVSALARRDGKLLAVSVPGEPPFIFEDVDSEAGPNTSFYSYSAVADSVVLYRARADKIEFILVHRPTGSTTDIPNEPKFNSDGRFFVTSDFCKEGCENRITVWRVERRGPTRERVFVPRTPWSDADVSWGSPRRLIVDATANGKSAAINLDMNDPRWNVLLP